MERDEGSAHMRSERVRAPMPRTALGGLPVPHGPPTALGPPGHVGAAVAAATAECTAAPRPNDVRGGGLPVPHGPPTALGPLGHVGAAAAAATAERAAAPSAGRAAAPAPRHMMNEWERNLWQDGPGCWLLLVACSLLVVACCLLLLWVWVLG